MVNSKIVKEFVSNKLATSNLWAKKALLLLYSYQTRSEQESRETKEYNNIGFSGCDGKFLSSLAQQLESEFIKVKAMYSKISENEAINRAYLSEKQLTALRNTIKKYSAQVINASDPIKLQKLVENI